MHVELCFGIFFGYVCKLVLLIGSMEIGRWNKQILSIGGEDILEIAKWMMYFCYLEKEYSYHYLMNYSTFYVS